MGAKQSILASKEKGPQQISFDGMWSPTSLRRRLTVTDFLGLNTCLYEWADSYDSKDWDRLRKCIAPTLRVSSLQFSLLKEVDQG
jgi:hypothetical protein